MNDKNNEPVTRGEFKEYLENHVAHLEEDVGTLKKAISFIKGELYVLIPLVVVTLGAVLTVLLM